MRKTVLVAVAVLAFLAGAPAMGTDRPTLDAVFAFDDPAHCVPSAGFGAIIDRLAVPEANGGWHGGELVLPAGYESFIAYYDKRGQVPMTTEVVGNIGHSVTTLMRGDWHGLPVSSLSIQTPPANWPRPRLGLWVELQFDADPALVDTVLSELGFPRVPLAAPATLTCRFR